MLQTLLSRRKPKSWCVEEEISLRRREIFSAYAFLTFCITELQPLLLYTFPNHTQLQRTTQALQKSSVKIRLITDSTQRLSSALPWYLILLSSNHRGQRQNGNPYFFHSQESRSISRELLGDEREGINIFNHYEESSEIKEEREDGSRKFPSPTSAIGEENNARSPTFILPPKLVGSRNE